MHTHIGLIFNFFGPIFLKKGISCILRKSQHHHLFQHIQIKLNTKVKQTNLNFGIKFPQKRSLSY